MNMKEFNNKAKEIFDYYNGRINNFNKVEKFITSSVLKKIHGAYIYPNTVYIYTNSICKCFEGIEVKEIELRMYLKLIETILHELYHADQMLLGYDNNIENMEGAVKYQSYYYILYHLDEIKEVFNIDLYPIKALLYSIFHKYAIYDDYYSKRTMKQHIMQRLAKLSTAEDQYIIETHMYNKNTNILCNILYKDKTIKVDKMILRNEGVFIDVNSFNEELNYIKCILNTMGSLKTKVIKNNLIINIRCHHN